MSNIDASCSIFSVRVPERRQSFTEARTEALLRQASHGSLVELVLFPFLFRRSEKSLKLLAYIDVNYVH